MTTIQVRIAYDDKKAAQAALEAIGMDLPSAIRVFLKKVAEVGGIPFNLIKENKLDENGFTQEQVERILQAERDAKAGINVSPSFDNMEDAIAFLRSQKDED